jgi:hypothetical protein
VVVSIVLSWLRLGGLCSQRISLVLIGDVVGVGCAVLLVDLDTKECYRRDDDDSAIALLIPRWNDGNDGDVSSSSQDPFQFNNGY